MISVYNFPPRPLPLQNSSSPDARKTSTVSPLLATEVVDSREGELPLPLRLYRSCLIFVFVPEDQGELMLGYDWSKLI